MRVDVWSDIACPWCWVGKRHLEAAIRNLGLEKEVVVEFRSFELNPARRPSEPAKLYLARRFGSVERVEAAQDRLRELGEAAGLAFDFERQLVARTFDAHRVHHLAKARGRGPEVVERFMRAYHGEGADLSDPATVRQLAIESGLHATEVDETLAGDAYTAEVRGDQADAKSYGIQGVPFFVFDGRYALSGAHPVEAFEQALKEAQRASAPPQA